MSTDTQEWTEERVAAWRHRLAGPLLSPLSAAREDIRSLLDALEHERTRSQMYREEAEAANERITALEVERDYWKGRAPSVF